MHHVVSISGGSASAVAADLVINAYGKENVTLYFCDTRWEDPDLYRFLESLEEYWDMTITRYVDGRNPLEVAEDRQLIPNSFAAPCSHILKQIPFRKYIRKLPKPVTVHLGLDDTEPHRHGKPREIYEAIPGVTVDYPLTWKPLVGTGEGLVFKYTRIVENWGVKPPHLYSLGFSHNNCGGRCVRAGVGEWLRLATYYPDRYAEVEQWELDQQAIGGARANRTILKEQQNGELAPVTLKALRERTESPQIAMFQTIGDSYSCFCDEYTNDIEGEDDDH